MRGIAMGRPARKWAALAIAGVAVLAAMSGAEAGSAPARAASAWTASLPQIMADSVPLDGDRLKTVFKVRPRAVNLDFYNPVLPNEHVISVGGLQRLRWSSYTSMKAVATGVLVLPYLASGPRRWRVLVTASHPRHGLFMQLYVTRFGAFHVHDKSSDTWACNRKRSYCQVAVSP